MKTILLAGLAILPVAAMAAPSAAQLAAQPANQSTTFSTGAPVHSPWVVLQQATLNASAGWNTNSTTTVVPSSSSSSFTLRIQNNASTTAYVVVRSDENSNLQYPQTGFLCSIGSGQTISNYFTSSECLQAFTQNNYTQGTSPAYIYVSTSDLTSGSYANQHWQNCSGSGLINNPAPSTNPFTVNQLTGTVIVTINSGTCSVSQ